MDFIQQQISFGFLAISNGKLTQQQLAIALRDWYSSGSTPLPEIIASLFGFDRETMNVLLAMASSNKDISLDAVDMYPTIAPDYVTVDQPINGNTSSVASRADSTQIREPTLHAIGNAEESQDSKDLAKAQGNKDRTFRPRFEVVRTHAKGGLGEVFVARDRELQREVALKEIQLKHAKDPDCRSRFVLEAQVTGCLEHPGIVPVYSLGEHEDGRLYYAMRFIQGESLKEAIDRSFQEAEKEQGSKTAGRPTVAFHKLLNRFIHLCNAVGFAHSRGVLHRDIKPANVMLGKYDETLLVDWGLAKIKGRTESQRESHDSTEQTLRLMPAGDSSATQLGTLVGTPAFMSPEQANGSIDAIGPASDIYSLGATFYYLLTGTPPFSRDSVLRMLEKVKLGEFQPPRAVLASVPKSLESICLKSMSTQPNDRYASASALAEDIERWLADEPIDVHQETHGEKLSRWMRRNRSLFSSAFAALSLVSMISIISSIAVNAARHEAVNAKSRAERSARNAIASEAIATDLQKKTEIALAESNSHLAKTSFLLSLFNDSDRVGQGKGIYVGTTTSFNLTARELLDRGANRLKADKMLSTSPLVRAGVLEAFGDVCRQLGAFAEAKPILDEALEVRQNLLPSDHPDVAESLFDLGSWYHEQGDYEKGKNHYLIALDIRKKIAGDEGQKLVANTLHNMAWSIANEGDAEKGRLTFLEAAKIRERVFGPTHRDTVFSHIGAAYCSIEQERYLEAAPKLLWARSQLPQIADNKNANRALITYVQALLCQLTIGAKFAEGSFREAYRLTELELGPDNIYTALTRYELGNNQVLLKNYDEAMIHLEACLKVARNAVQLKHPRVRILISTYSNQLKRMGRYAEGEALWNEFLTAQKSRFGDDHRFVLEAMVNQAAYLRAIGKKQEAIKILELVEEGLKKLDFASQPWLLAQSFCDRCSMLGEKNENYARVDKLAIESISIFEEHPRLKKEHPLEWSYLQTSLALQHQDYQSAAELCLRRKSECRKLTVEKVDILGDLMIEIAGDLMRCIELVETQETLTGDEKKTIFKRLDSDAIEVLKAAIAADSKNRKSIRDDSRFARLREIEKFIELTKPTT